jgi:ribonuclease T2
MSRNQIAVFLIVLAGLFSSGPGTRPAFASDNFDFYVLSLSWSPSWCASHDRSGSSAQCGGKRRYGLVVHGLWPQNERGWPEDCQSDEPDRVPESLIRPLSDIIPSIGLAGHEWRKHGTCSGLTQSAYFKAHRTAYDRVRLPPLIFDGDIGRRLSTDQIENQLLRANPGLSAKAISLSCDGGQLAEIRVCMTKSLEFRDCPQSERNACRTRIVSLPPIP